MKQFASIFILILCLNFTLAAQNLIVNGDFETYSACPGNGNGQGVVLASPWQSANLQSSPVYINACAPSSSCCGVPVNFTFGYQYPRSGNGFAAFAAYSSGHSNLREYLRYPLSSTLETGNTYCLTFYVNLMNDSYEAIDAIGAYFTDSALVCPTLYCLLNYPAQVNNPTGNILTDTLGWTQISGCFTAQGNENYMLIGNFKTDAQTQTALSLGTAGTSYDIDDVNLYEDTSLSIKETEGEISLSVFPNPAKDVVTITSKKELHEIALLELSGKIILLKQGSKTIDVSGVSDGLYLLRCKFKEGEVIYRKIVVSRE